MKVSEGILAGFSAVLVNKLRTTLTMLDIIIRVGSVLALISVGDGAKAVVMREANRFGSVDQFSFYHRSHLRKGDCWIWIRSNKYFTYDDVLAIEVEAPSFETVVPRILVWEAQPSKGKMATNHGQGIMVSC